MSLGTGRLALALGAVLATAALAWVLVAEPEPIAGAAGGRIVSLSPPITETLHAIGAGPQVVGRSAWDRIPPEVERLPAVGSALSPDLEAIVRLGPSHILTERTQAGPVDQLRAVAPTTVLPWLTVEEATDSIRRLGVLTGREAEARALARRMRDAFAATPPPDAPRALLALGVDDVASGEVWYVKPGSLHGRALAAAGLRNVVEQDVEGTPTLSTEALLRLDPDVILVLFPAASPDEGARVRIVGAFDGLAHLSAVRSRAIEVVHGDDVYGTGPGLIALVERLREAGGRALSRSAAR